MKFKIFLLTAMIVTTAMTTVSYAAESKCMAKEEGSVHEGFCANVGIVNCKIHSMCRIVKEEKVVKVIVAEESCTAKAGSEAHEGFCAKLTKQTCATHSSLCNWK